MIDRYTRKEMGDIWSLQNRFDQMLKVEKAVASVQARLKMIPLSANKAIQEKARFNLKEILKIEKETKHDISAFVKNVSSFVGKEAGLYVHYGLTSSDVLDTALSLQMLQSFSLIQKEINKLKKTIQTLIQKHKKTLCAGRTHGMHAEPTTFGFKLLGFLFELNRAHESLNQAIQQGAVGALSGPVGTYSSLSESVEKEVCRKLQLQPEDISTQVIPRDRHARIIFSLNLILLCLERLAIELRHLQRTEVGEVKEGFGNKQQGSSSMPHKKNPISAENITGLCRLLRSYVQASLENTALWHERDISHSSVERVIFPDAFILCDYALYRMSELLKNLEVDKNRMKQNMMVSQGDIFSSQILISLIRKGVDRQQAYKWIQKASHTKGKKSLQENLGKEILKHFKTSELDQIFSGKQFCDRISQITDQKLKQQKSSYVSNSL